MRRKQMYRRLLETKSPGGCRPRLHVVLPAEVPVIAAASVSPEILEPIRRQLRVPDRMLDIAMAQVGLQGAGIMALVGQRETAGVPKHVRVCLELEARSRTSALYKPRKACRGEGRAPLRREDER